jgi:thiol-disulfide isomerase/thioredoxin
MDECMYEDSDGFDTYDLYNFLPSLVKKDGKINRADLIRDLREAELDESMFWTVLRHLPGCPRCQSIIATLEAVQQLLKGDLDFHKMVLRAEESYGDLEADSVSEYGVLEDEFIS